MNTSTTIYISRVNLFHTEESLRTQLSTSNIGIVCSVDFIIPNQTPGFQEPAHHSHFKAAFVHFRHLNNQHEFLTHIHSGKKFRIDVSSTEFWLCSKAHHPVPRTIMNIHQVVDNCRYLELIVSKHTDTIMAQQLRIQLIEQQLASIVDKLTPAPAPAPAPADVDAPAPADVPAPAPL